MKTELATQFASERIDEAAGIIFGVSVITEGEAKGHGFDIDQTTLSQVVECGASFPDGVRVKIDHGTGFDAIVGTLKAFRVDGDKVRADLHLVKAHPRYAAIVEMAKNMPGAFGLSISFSGKAENRAARCTELYSVDFVAVPAANPDGLFSAPVDSQTKGKAMTPIEFAAEVKNLITGESGKTITDLTAKLEKAATDLAAAQSKITELEKTASELSAAKLSVETLTKERDELKATLADPSSEIEKRASVKALELAQKQGTTAITLKPGETDTTNTIDPKLTGLERAIAAHKLSQNKA